MLHEPVSSGGIDLAADFKKRLGVWMFVFYLLFYAGFVYLNLANPLSMELVVCCGLNLATVYGFALIVVALLQALVYSAICTAREAAMDAEAAQSAEGRDS